MLTFALTLLVEVEGGIIVGALFALLMFVWRTGYPDVTELGYVEEEDAYLGVRSFPEGKTYPEVLIIRFDASLYYANVPHLEEWLSKAVAARPRLKWIVINCRGVNSVDMTAVEGMEDLISGYRRRRRIEILFAGVKRPIRDRLRRAGWDENSAASPTIRPRETPSGQLACWRALKPVSTGLLADLK